MTFEPETEKPEGQISPLVLATVLSIALVLSIEFVVWFFSSPSHRLHIHTERSSGTEGLAP